MARVSGILILTVAPSPRRLKISTTPPIFSMWDFTTSMPTPRPEKLVTVFRGREPRLEDQAEGLAIAQLLRLFQPQEPIFQRLLFNPRDVDPRPVIADFDVDLSRLRDRHEGSVSLVAICLRDADFRQFDAVVARIADQVHQRILDGLDDGPVEFRLRSVHL